MAWESVVSQEQSLAVANPKERLSISLVTGVCWLGHQPREGKCVLACGAYLARERTPNQLCNRE